MGRTQPSQQFSARMMSRTSKMVRMIIQCRKSLVPGSHIISKAAYAVQRVPTGKTRPILVRKPLKFETLAWRLETCPQENSTKHVPSVTVS